MYRLWKLATAYKTRPSTLLGVDGVPAFHLDYQVWNFGTSLDAALQEAVEPKKQGKKSKALTTPQKRHALATVLEKWLGVSGIKRYRDPALGFKKSDGGQ